jgi:hypothetical protein
VKLRKTLNDLVRVIADEAERNPDFENRVAAALGLKEQAKEPGHREIVAANLIIGGSQRPKNRRPPPVLDPIEIAQSGERVLRERLANLSLEQLRDIVAEFGMDSGKLVIKWKTADRIIERIVEISIARAQKGDAFRSETSLRGETGMDSEYTHARLMAALKGLADGKTPSDAVQVPPYGQSTKIGNALNDAAKHLNEPFHADDLDTVDKTFKKLGLTRTSDRKNDVANAILKGFTR